MKTRLWPGWLAYSVVTYTFLVLAVIIPPVVDSFGITVGRAGLIGTVLNVALAASAGWLTFRHLSSKPALVVGFALQAVGNGATTLATDHVTYLAWGAVTGFGMGMALAGGYRVAVAGDDVGRRTAIITSAVPVTALTTPLAGVFIDVGGWQLTHAVMAGYALVAAMAVGFVDVPEPGHDPEAPTSKTLLSLWRPYAASAIWAVGTSGVLLFVGAQLEEVFDVDPIGVGAVVAGTGVLGFLSTQMVGRLDGYRRRQALVPILLASGILALLYVTAGSVWLAIVWVELWSIAYWAGFASLQAIIGTEAGSNQAGALTFFQTPWSLGLAIGPTIVGALIDAVDFTMIGWVALAAALVTSGLLFRR